MRLPLAAAIALILLIPVPFAWAASPAVGTVIPASGSSLPDQWVTFTTTTTDADGWTNLQDVRFLTNTSTSQVNTVSLWYVRSSNKLYVLNNAGTTWIGGVAPGSNTVLENSQGRLDCALTTVTGSGTTLTVKWKVSFKPAYSGRAYKTYLWAKDNATSTGWVQKGTWAVNRAPGAGTITPAAGTTAPDQWADATTTYTDGDGWTNLKEVRLLVNTSTSLTNAVAVRYLRSVNKLYLLNDTGTTWLGGATPGTSTILENSQGRLNCALTTVTGSGTTLTVKWRVNFKPAYAGQTYKTYLYAEDNIPVNTGWVQKGTWTVDGTSPTTPVITDDGDWTASTTALHAAWTSSDPETGIAEYQYQITRDSAIGTVIVPWTSTGTATEVTKTGLSLTHGKKYLFSVKAKNGVNLWSTVGASDGIFVDVNAPLIGTVTPADGTTYVEGALVLISVVASDADGDALQYQFLVDGVAKQPWGSVSSWMWNTTGIVREHTITVQVRDPYTRQVEQNFKLFGYRRPRGTP